MSAVICSITASCAKMAFARCFATRWSEPSFWIKASVLKLPAKAVVGSPKTAMLAIKNQTPSVLVYSSKLGQDVLGRVKDPDKSGTSDKSGI